MKGQQIRQRDRDLGTRMVTLQKQTWVCSPPRSKAGLLTLSRGEGNGQHLSQDTKEGVQMAAFSHRSVRDDGTGHRWQGAGGRGPSLTLLWRQDLQFAEGAAD